MNNDFDYDNADRKDLLERCKSFEVAVESQHTLCMNSFKERDTYRDLCEELLKELKTLKRSAEKLEAPHENKSAMFFYCLSVLRESVAISNSAITKAEAILGDKNGTAN